jgi:hypothetical protein
VKKLVLKIEKQPKRRIIMRRGKPNSVKRRITRQRGEQ